MCNLEQVLSSNRPLNVLVVDDHPANRTLLMQQLTYLGHRVRICEQGREGLLCWLKDTFDVVITDCNMPVLDGYQLARAIREHERRTGKDCCLILAVTANVQAFERDRCLAAGMDACLFKPLSIKVLEEVLRGRGSAPAELAPSELSAALPEVDISSLMKLTGGDPAAVRALLGDLLSSNRQDLRQLDRLHHGKDLRGLADLVHRLKGGARIIRAHGLLGACAQLEQACSSCAPVHRIRPLVGRLRQSILALERVLERYCQRE